MKHTEYIVPIGEEATDYDEMFIGVIRRQPEMIRCKDCKHYEVAELNYDGTPDKRCKPSVCTNGKYAIERAEDWYCGDAEPKEVNT